MLRWALLGLGLVGIIVLPACERCGRRDRAELRAALVSYGEFADRALAKQARFISIWQESLDQESIDDLRGAGVTRVLPALDAYLEVLQAQEPSAEELAGLHATLLDAWRQFGARLEGYYDRVDSNNLTRRNAELEVAWVRLGARIVDHRRKLSALCDDVGLAYEGSLAVDLAPNTSLELPEAGH